MMQRRPTLTDVAEAAGVSYATADRVVNGRGRVADKSVQRVQSAISQLGYVRNVAAANLSQQRSYRFVVLIPDGQNAFFARMRGLLSDAAARLIDEGVIVTIQTVAAFDAAALADALLGLTDADGVACVGLSDARVADAAAQLRARGIGVAGIVSDLSESSRDAYVGIDNTAAGRTAGRLVALAHRGRAGQVLPIVGSLAAPDHADRLAGFRAVAATHGALSVLDPITSHDLPARVFARAAAVLAGRPDITAIYSMGAGNSGLIRLLATLPDPRPVVVLHELVAGTRAALASGLIDVVIDQCPEQQIAGALDTLRRIADRRSLGPASPISPTIYVPDNLPAAPAEAPSESTSND